MLRLIRNCSHNNEVSTFYLEDGTGKWIIKSSSSTGGIEQIKQEIKGWDWYSSRVYLNGRESFCQVMGDKQDYIKIRVKYIDGHKAKYSGGILRNSDMVSNAIKHYFSVWGKGDSGFAPLHGDLSIDNLVSNKERVRIIDWEHFNLKGAPVGFDAYNLLFEQLWFSLRGRKNIKRRELIIFLDNIRLIRKSGGSVYFHEQPLFSLQKFIKENQHYWKKQAQRLPVLLYSEEQVSFIDGIIRLHM